MNRRSAAAVGVPGGVAIIWLAALVRFRTWIAEGDNAVFQLRLERLLDGHVPTTGAYSRLQFHHPGPLREWLVGALYALSGHRAAALPATALVLNLVWIGSACWLAWRALRGPGLAAAALTAGALAIGMDWRLHSVWNPHLAVFTGFALLWGTIAAVTTRGRHIAVALIAGSLLAQLHVAGALAGLVATITVVAFAWRQTPRRATLAAGAVVLMWIGPLVDVVDGGGVNAIEVLRGATGDRVGVRTALRIAAGLARPWSLVEGDFIAPYAGLPTTAPLWQALLVGTALAGAAAVVWKVPPDRRGATDRGSHAEAARALTGVAFGAFVVAVVSCAIVTYPVWPYLFAALTAGFAAPATLLVYHAARLVGRSDARWATNIVPLACVGIAAAATVPGVVSIERIVSSPLERSLRGAVTSRVVPGREYTITRAGLRTGTDGELALYVHQAGGRPHSPWFHLDLPSPDGAFDVFVAAMDEPLDCLGAAAPESARVAYGESRNIAAPVGVFHFSAEEWNRLVPVCALPDPQTGG